MDRTPRIRQKGPPAKISEGYFRFLCSRCGEMRATVNPHNNLAHCFCCQQNLNDIDLLLALGYDFRAAVTLFERWLNQSLTPKTGQSNKLLLAVQEGGHDGEETEGTHGGVQGAGARNDQSRHSLNLLSFANCANI